MLLKEFQNRSGEIEERFSEITQHNETVVEIKKDIKDKTEKIRDISKNAKDLEKRLDVELKALKYKANEQEKFSSILSDKISKNSKEIYIVWNGEDPESDTEKDIDTQNKVNHSEQNSEVQEEALDTTSDNVLDQTFLNPSAGFNCKNCNYVATNKSGLKKHNKSKHNKN